MYVKLSRDLIVSPELLAHIQKVLSLFTSISKEFDITNIVDVPCMVCSLLLVVIALPSRCQRATGGTIFPVVPQCKNLKVSVEDCVKFNNTNICF